MNRLRNAFLCGSYFVQNTFTDPEIQIREAKTTRDRLEELLSTVQFERLPYGKIVLICAILFSSLSLYLFISNDFHNAHFDSKGHQLVPRRIADNLSPGWIQIGAFWLPLPHVLYYPLTKIDWIYFNGFAGIPFSVLSYILSVVLLFKLLKHVVDPISAFLATTLYLINTNILYLQSTSLTEGLSIVFSLAAVYFFVRYELTQLRKWLLFASVVSAFGVLIRYENWFTFGLIGLLMMLLHIKSKRGFKKILSDGLLLGLPNFAAIALTFWINWWTTGSAFIDVTNKFTDWQPGQGSYLLSLFVSLYTLGKLVSFEWTIASVAAFFMMFKRKFRQPAFIASLAIVGPLILYMIQYHDGHPTRIRYGLLLVPACYFFLAHFPERSRLMRYLFLVFALFINTSSYYGKFESSELLEESLRDASNLSLQSDLLWYFKQHDDGTLVLVAMGEIAPVVYDLKIPIKRFVHEGAKPWWNDARKEPEKWVGWVFISQDDKLWKIFHDDPNFHKHFKLIGRRNFLELYRRSTDEEANIKSHRAHGTNLKGEIPVFNKDQKP